MAVGESSVVSSVVMGSIPSIRSSVARNIVPVIIEITVANLSISAPLDNYSIPKAISVVVLYIAVIY